MSDGMPGRPSAFRAEFVEQARKLAQMGHIDREIAEFFAVTDRTLNTWKHKHPDFADALKLGKDAADDRVEKALYHKAVGYTFDSEKILTVNGVIERVPIVEHVPPSDTAAIFWLKNRRRDEWRDRQDHELTGKNGGPIEVEQRVLADADAFTSAIAGLAARAVATSGDSEPQS